MMQEVVIYEVEKTRPKNNPDTEFIIVRTTGISREAYAWLQDNFGLEHCEHPRWFLIARSLFFRYEEDYIWFMLRWK
jgi:hypothetical protein